MPLNHSGTVPLYDAKAHFSELVAQAEAGQEITITRHGTPVVKLVPVKQQHSPEERRAAIERLIENRKGITLGGLKIRDLIEKGRR
ncbi:MAG TPA: type II toxin-antitoxin system prevent-host-death family antitoxin [Lacipirellulaceae bacterium]|jgi:prevent-host-death family protein